MMRRFLKHGKEKYRCIVDQICLQTPISKKLESCVIISPSHEQETSGAFLHVLGGISVGAEFGQRKGLTEGIMVSFVHDHDTIWSCITHPVGPTTDEVQFETLLTTIGLPRSFHIDVYISAETSQFLYDHSVPRHHVGWIEGRRWFPAPARHTGLSPLLVSGLGRSGTTAMMQCLSSHPGVVILPNFPFENQPAQYWLHATKVMSSPSSPALTRPMVGFQQNPHTVSSNPFIHTPFLNTEHKLGNVSDFYQETHVKKLFKSTIVDIETYYKSLSRDLKKQSAGYYCEKTQPNFQRLIFYEFYRDVKEIFIIRNPADVICSVRSFFEEPFYESENYIEALKVGYERLLESYEDKADTALIVRYEDMINDPKAFVEKVIKYTGLDSSQYAIDRCVNSIDVNTTNAHVTSTSIQKSVDRWKNDLTENELCQIKKIFAEVLIKMRNL